MPYSSDLDLIPVNIFVPRDKVLFLDMLSSVAISFPKTHFPVFRVFFISLFLVASKIAQWNIVDTSISRIDSENNKTTVINQYLSQTAAEI